MIHENSRSKRKKEWIKSSRNKKLPSANVNYHEWNVNYREFQGTKNLRKFTYDSRKFAFKKKKRMNQVFRKYKIEAPKPCQEIQPLPWFLGDSSVTFLWNKDEKIKKSYYHETNLIITDAGSHDVLRRLPRPRPFRLGEDISGWGTSVGFSEEIIQ